ncbi:MAG TPA: sugar phosphate nucleotidyltransferase [Thermoleophilaceae bacterium]
MLPVVAILCGGKGTRMREGGETLPKPLVEIGAKPILWHVMSLYAGQGFERFLLLTGNGAGKVEEFAADLPWEVACVDTGAETPTGGRVHRAREHLTEDSFCLTYADGVADIDLRALLGFHHDHGAAATITVVQPSNPWGVAELQGDAVTRFHEKPKLDSWVNGGFMVMDPRALDYMGPDDVLERAPLERLAEDDELRAFRHEGFWDCMDTYKDTLLLNELWHRGEAPWRPLVEA